MDQAVPGLGFIRKKELLSDWSDVFVYYCQLLGKIKKQSHRNTKKLFLILVPALLMAK